MRKVFLLILFNILFIVSTQKLSAQPSPAIIWDKTIGGDLDDNLKSLIQTSDGGYILGGWSNSGMAGDKSMPSKGNSDFWLVKLNGIGSKIWDKAFGGNKIDELTSVIQTSDGGLLVGGSSDSDISGDKTNACKGNLDYWVVKLDGAGNKIWDKTFGGSNEDNLTSVSQTADGGFILGGYSYSGISGDKTSPNKGLTGTADYWVVKLDSVGNITWNQTMGGGWSDLLYSILNANDGSFMLAGVSYSTISGDKTGANNGNCDYWLVKLDPNGNKIWDKTYGGNNVDRLSCLIQTTDQGFLLGGWSDSGISGDKSKPNKGGSGTHDYWVIKIDKSGNKMWDNSYGGTSNDNNTSISQTSDGNYILNGSSDSWVSADKSQQSKGVSDYWAIKINGNGVKLWDKTIGANANDIASTVMQTADGGYMLGGSSVSTNLGDKSELNRGPGYNDFWIIKIAGSCPSVSPAFRMSCGNSGIIVEVTGIYTGAPSWELSYLINGASQTVQGTSSTILLASNAVPGNVYSLVSLTSGTCSNNLSNSITIPLLPAAPTVRHGSSCDTGQVTLRATGAPAGRNYIWSTSPMGGTIVQTSQNGIFVTPLLANTTTYYVSVDNIAGCEGPRTPAVATITKLSVQAGGTQTICQNAAPTQFSGFSPIGGIWSGPGVSTSGIFTPDNLIGKQILTYTIFQDSCVKSATKEITVIPVQDINLGTDLEACNGEEIRILPNISSGAFLWNDGSTAPTLTVKKSGNYWVRFIQNGCETTDSVQVTFKDCPPPLNLNVPFIPNIVTVNNDGQNDTFRPMYLPEGKLHLKIYNRWGIQIYESEDYQNKWPEKNLSYGTYFYKLKNLNTGDLYKGWVEVMH